MAADRAHTFAAFLDDLATRETPNARWLRDNAAEIQRLREEMLAESEQQGRAA